MSTSFARGSESGSLKDAGDFPSYVKTDYGWSCLKIMMGEKTLCLLFSAFLFCSVFFSITAWGEKLYNYEEMSEKFRAFDDGFFAKGLKAYFADKNDEALYCFNESRKRCGKLGNIECMLANTVMTGLVYEAVAVDYKQKAFIYKKMSDAESMRKSLKVALSYSEKALDVFEAAKNEPKIADTLWLITGIYKGLGDDETASKYELRAYKLNRKLGRRLD